MNIIEAAKLANTQGVQLIRSRKDNTQDYDVKPAFTGNNRGWTLLDGYTASAITQIHAALSDANKIKYAALPLPKLLNVTWGIVNKH